jgi:hypothetical protein
VHQTFVQPTELSTGSVTRASNICAAYKTVYRQCYMCIKHLCSLQNCLQAVLHVHQTFVQPTELSTGNVTRANICAAYRTVYRQCYTCIKHLCSLQNCLQAVLHVHQTSVQPTELSTGSVTCAAVALCSESCGFANCCNIQLRRKNWNNKVLAVSDATRPVGLPYDVAVRCQLEFTHTYCVGSSRIKSQTVSTRTAVIKLS